MAQVRAHKIEVLCVLFLSILTVIVAPEIFAQVSTSIPSNSVSVLTTQNTSLFQPVVSYASGGTSVESVAVADVNGDGKPDLVVGNCNPQERITCAGRGVIGVLLGNGDGTFQPVVKYDSGGFGAESVAIADVNGDGKLDVVVANECGSSTGCPSDGFVDVLLGNGDGTFQRAVGYSTGGIAAFSVKVADVNGDGKPDIVVANYLHSVSVLLGNGDGTFQPPASYSTGGSPASAVVADVNGDGKPDLILANAMTNGNVGVLRGNGDGTFQPVVTYGSGGRFPYSVAVADVNGDSIPDLMVPNLCVISDTSCLGLQNGPVSVLLGNGDSTFQPAVTYDSGGLYTISIAVADLNGDGKQEIVVTNVNSSDIGVLLGIGDGTFEPALTYSTGGHPLAVAVGDLNGDRSPDVVAGNYGPGSVGILLNSTSVCTTPPVVTVSANPRSVWPPNGRMVPVTVSGTIIDTGCTVKTAAFTIRDEYGEVQPSGPVTVGAGGAYSFIVSLQVSRLGSDLDGRQYTITVGASNNVGKTGSQSATVIVPHDRR